MLNSKHHDGKRACVCFICLDNGGEFVQCKRKTCAKYYHLECIGWDADSFQKMQKGFCGFHVCSICSARPHKLFRCYTCPTAYCSARCADEAGFLCVEQFGMNGLCEECRQLARMIDQNKETTVNAAAVGLEVDFNDEETYECLFKEYWEDRRQSIPRPTHASLHKERIEVAAEEGGQVDTTAAFKSGDDDPEEGESHEGTDDKPNIKPREFDGWASKELMEILKLYMDHEDLKEPRSRLQVTKLLWSYIRSHKLQDPKKNRARISCDDRLRTLFGKDSVGQFQLFKHLQYHLARSAKGGGERVGQQYFRDEEPSADHHHGSAAGDDKKLSEEEGHQVYKRRPRMKVYKRRPRMKVYKRRPRKTS